MRLCAAPAATQTVSHHKKKKYKKLTAQAANRVILKEKEFNLVGFTNDGLIKPQDFGIKPIMSSTACWRGYITKYEISEDSKFILKEVLVKTDNEDLPKLINGVSPESPNVKFMKRAFNNQYLNIDLQVNYSGYVLLGNDFIRELYVHMGFHPAWKYKEVFEIEIDKGKVISISDLSEKMEVYRSIIKEEKEKKENSNSPKKDEIEEWVKRTFDQKYQKEKNKYGG